MSRARTFRPSPRALFALRPARHHFSAPFFTDESSATPRTNSTAFRATKHVSPSRKPSDATGLPERADIRASRHVRSRRVFPPSPFPKGALGSNHSKSQSPKHKQRVQSKFRPAPSIPGVILTDHQPDLGRAFFFRNSRARCEQHRHRRETSLQISGCATVANLDHHRAEIHFAGITSSAEEKTTGHLSNSGIFSEKMAGAPPAIAQQKSPSEP